MRSGLSASLNNIAHRGPDGEGTFFSNSENCILGHRRLSILDLSDAAMQPMSRDGGVLAFNGEIYNHISLRSSRLSGTDFSTHSDTETLTWGLRLEGIDFLHRLKGMFAGAYFDEHSERLLFFRDGLGIKPFYFHIMADSTLVFASEIKAILGWVPGLRKVSKATLSSYWQYENWKQGPTLFQGIHLLKPGEIFSAHLSSAGKCIIEFQGKLSHGSQFQTEPFSPKNSDTLAVLRNSVKSHLLSDVPVGVYLSGGIDSSLVAALASEERSDLLSFTGYFNTRDAFYDERPLASVVASKFGIEQCTIPIAAQDLQNHLDDLIYSLDEPRMGMGAFSQFVVAKTAAKHRKVVLSGHGGDELFAGYILMKVFWFLKQGHGLSEILRSIKSFHGKEWPWLVHQVISRFRDGNLHFAPRLMKVPEGLSVFTNANSCFLEKAGPEPVTQLSNYYRDVYLPGLLMVEDKISMAFGLETRTPLWSQDVVEWASKIPIEEKLLKGQLKAVLKNAAKEILPHDLLNAPKRGFPSPLRLWFRHELQDFLRHRLLSPNNPLQSLIPMKEIKRLLDAHRSIPLPFSLDERRAHRIWILLCLESWMRQYEVACE